MSDLVKSTAGPNSKSRRAKARTVNNNIKGFTPYRRYKNSRVKLANFTIDMDMPVPGNMVEKEISPGLSSITNDRATRVKPEWHYSRDKLMELRCHPLSIKKHQCLESPQNKLLLSGRTNSRRRIDSLTEEDRSDGSFEPQKKRMNDPKSDRLRKDQEVVLSPQRRSFNSGCFVNPKNLVTPSNNRQQESPHKGERDPNHRELPSRRIGSGRIMREPLWELRSLEKEDVPHQMINNQDFSFRQRDDRFERRSFERSHDKERPQQRNTRYNDKRKAEKVEPEEPEWFSGGPTSQHDTIELHGFDGPVEEKTTSKKQNKIHRNSSKINRKGSEKNESVGTKKSLPGLKSSLNTIEEPRPSSVTTENKVEHLIESTPQKSLTHDHAATQNQDSERVFDIDEYLNFDSLPPLLSITNGCSDQSGSGSRFSQFFRRKTPSPNKGQRADSQFSSADEMFSSMINELTSTNIDIPPDGDTYFAPISPAAPSIKHDSSKGPPASLLDMLQRANYGVQGRKISKKTSFKDLEVSGIYSVEELEARLRQGQGASGNPRESSSSNCKEEELAAFRKLMMNKQGQEMKHSSHPNVGGGFQSHHRSTLHPGSATGHHGLPHHQQTQQLPIPHDFVMKLLHVQQQQRQQDFFAKLLTHPSRQFNVPPPPMPSISPDVYNNAQATKDLLQRPEAQAILGGLRRGEFTILHLVEQVKRSPHMQPLQREILTNIIKLHSLQSNVNVGQRELSPANLASSNNPEQLLHQLLHNQQTQHHHHQQLRIPSPHSNG